MICLVVVSIDLLVLWQNLQIVCCVVFGLCLWVVVKVNVYGYGVVCVWSVLSVVDGFVLFNLEEVILLCEQGWKGLILLLEGFFYVDELVVLD